jgi:hypothetical protein
MSQLVTQPRGLLTLADHLLIQVEQADALTLSTVTARVGGGLVVCGGQALKVIEYLQGRSYAGALLPDRQRYKGKRRKLASEPFDPTWIARQRRLGLAAIVPDAGYVAERDLAGLRCVLRQSAAIPGAVALLALANWWMYGEGLRLLLAELRGTGAAGLHDTGQPVALVLEHPKDPLGVLRVLQGVVALLRSGVTVLMLRCDVSALGVIAYGGLAAAYGSKTSVRHLYPAPKPGSGGGGGAGLESAFWPAGTALHYRNLLYDAVMASPHDPHWSCWCAVCGGRTLDRLAGAAVEEVRQHNASGLLDLRAELVTASSTTDRQRWWVRRCREAQQAHAVVESGSVVLPCPQALIWWQQV